MKTNLNALLLVLVDEASIQALSEENKKLREHAAGYDRLRVTHEQLKARANAMESRIRDDGRALEWNLQQRTGLELEVRQLKEQVLELGRQNIALAAEAERAEMAEQQLAGADARIKELEAALLLASLPAGSRDNVIQMVREAA